MKTYSSKEIMEILGLDIETVTRFLREGKIIGFKAGREWRVLEEDLMKYINDNKNVKEVI